MEPNWSGIITWTVIITLGILFWYAIIVRIMEVV